MYMYILYLILYAVIEMLVSSPSISRNLNTGSDYFGQTEKIPSLIVTVILKCIKLKLTKVWKWYQKVYKICCINIHFTGNPFTFIKYCIFQLLYKNITHCQNKTLYNNMFLSTDLGVFFFLCIYRTRPKFINANKYKRFE